MNRMISVKFNLVAKEHRPQHILHTKNNNKYLCLHSKVCIQKNYINKVNKTFNIVQLHRRWIFILCHHRRRRRRCQRLLFLWHFVCLFVEYLSLRKKKNICQHNVNFIYWFVPWHFQW